MDILFIALGLIWGDNYTTNGNPILVELEKMIQEIITNTTTGILTQIPMLIIIVWGIRIIARETSRWLRQYHEDNMKEIALQRAVGMEK